MLIRWHGKLPCCWHTPKTSGNYTNNAYTIDAIEVYLCFPSTGLQLGEYDQLKCSFILTVVRTRAFIYLDIQASCSTSHAYDPKLIWIRSVPRRSAAPFASHACHRLSHILSVIHPLIDEPNLAAQVDCYRLNQFLIISGYRGTMEKGEKTYRWRTGHTCLRS